MASTATPYGLVPVNVLGGRRWSGGTFREFRQVTNVATAIYNGDIVIRYTAGILAASGDVVIAGAASPTTTNDATSPIGVCVGVRYTDPVLHQTLFSNYLPAGAITAGYTNVFVRVVDDPWQLFMLQADGAVYRSAIGYNGVLINFSGSTLSGKSTVALDASAVAKTNTFAVRLIDLVNSESVFDGGLSVPGDAYTDTIVMFNMGVHVYTQAYGNNTQ